MSYPYDESSYTPEGYYQVPQYQGYQPPQRGIMGTVSSAFPTPAEDRLRFKQEERARGGDLLDEVTGSTTGMDKNEYAIQLRTMAEQVNEFDTRMKMLNGVQKRMDPMGQKRLAEIMKRHEGLQNALNHGKISQLEMFRGASMLNQELGQFNWEAHTNGPGSAVGDVYEKDGYWFHNKPGEGPVPFDYTADERQKRTVRNPITGHVTIPTAPGKEPKILSPSELDDLNLEAKRIESLQRKIDKLAGELQQNPLNQKTPEENAAIAERLVGETEQRARRLYSKLYGKEGSLTGQQQTDQVEEEMGIQQPKPTTATHQAQLAQQKKDEKAKKEAEKAAKKTPEQAEKAQVEQVKGARSDVGPKLLQMLAAAGDDKDTQNEVRAKLWGEDPNLALRVDNAIVITGKVDRSKMKDGMVYMISNLATNTLMKVWYKDGKLWPMPDSGAPAQPQTPEDKRARETMIRPYMNLPKW